jgi:PEP-CTERM motif
MRKRILVKYLISLMIVASCSFATNIGQAAIIQGKIWQGAISESLDPIINYNPSSGYPYAEFVTHDINYDSRVGSEDEYYYTPASFLATNFSNESGGFDPNGNLDNTYILFTGKTYLSSGENTINVQHDDGFELRIPGIDYDTKNSAVVPTSPVTFTEIIDVKNAGTYDFILSYGECLEGAAVLKFQVNDPPAGFAGVASVPEPASIFLFGAGLAGIAALRKKINK